MNIMRSIHGLAALILIAFVPAAFAGEAGDPDQSCDGSTAEMVDCLGAKTVGQADDDRLSGGAEECGKPAAA